MHLSSVLGTVAKLSSYSRDSVARDTGWPAVSVCTRVTLGGLAECCVFFFQHILCYSIFSILKAWRDKLHIINKSGIYVNVGNP